MLPYNKKRIDFSRELRKMMTPCERKLWYHYLRHYPVKFRRQSIIGEYIADFYCAKAHLVIEIDGEGHFLPQNQINDNYRARILEEQNIKVLRFSNEEIEQNFYGVCEQIEKAVKLQMFQFYPSVTS